jgi:hypothetical protein
MYFLLIASAVSSSEQCSSFFHFCFAFLMVWRLPRSLLFFERFTRFVYHLALLKLFIS